jgi:colanic acid/amylovoran biosynthesis glycosyltransferase
MRIALFTEHYPATYKPYFDTQFADLVEQGHDITIYAGGRLSDSSLNEKVVRWRLDGMVRQFPTTLRTLPATARNILARGPAAVPLRAAARLTAQSPLRRRIVEMARLRVLRGPSPDLCLLHGLSAAALYPWIGQAFPTTPVALYYHGGETPSTRVLRNERVTTAFQRADVVFTNTAFSRDHAIERGCPADRIHVLPVGFDLRDYVPPVPRLYRADGVLRLFSAGRMSEEKGYAFALEALALLQQEGFRDFTYTLTGNGYYRPRLEEYVRSHGMEDRVRFLGTLTTGQVIRAMGEADALLLPSVQVGNWVENQACAVQEAMLMNTPVIVSRTGGVPQSVAPEMAPFICEPGSAPDLARAIRDLAALTADELARLGRAGRAFVEARYDITALNRRLLEVATATSRADRTTPTPG